MTDYEAARVRWPAGQDEWRQLCRRPLSGADRARLEALYDQAMAAMVGPGEWRQ